MDIKNIKRPIVRSRINPSGKKVYLVDYKDIETGKRIRKIIGTRKDLAEETASKIFDDQRINALGLQPEEKKKITVVDLIESFLRGKQGRIDESTISRYRIHARHFIAFLTTYFADIQHFDEIQKGYLDEHLNKLRVGGHKPRTLNAQRQFIRAIFKFAVDEGYISENPASGIRPYKETRLSERVEFWFKEEVLSILNEVKQPYRDAFEFLYNTGLRKGELIHLTWQDINLGEHPSVTIQTKDGWTPKSNTRRIVPLNLKSVSIIQRQSKSNTHNYIFKAPEGGKIHRDKIYRELKRALKVLGLQCDLHKFRHTFASHLVMKGVGIETVSKLLGHTTIEMTMIYAHLAPDHLERAVEMLD